MASLRSEHANSKDGLKTEYMLKKIRRILAVVMFACITLMFLDFTGTLHHWLGWMAKIQFLPSLLAMNVAVLASLIVLTLVFGRIYCSVICPLGVMQDLVAWLGGRRWKGNRWSEMRNNRYGFSRSLWWLRLASLMIIIAAFIAGIGSLVALLAPYSSYGRIATTLFQPLYISVNNLFAGWAESVGSYAFYHRDVWLRSTPTLVVAAVSFVVIAILAWRGGRTYCNTICPVGTILGLLARFSWLRVYIDKSKCKNCKCCEHSCKTSCIDISHHSIDRTRCVTCGVCLEKCKFGAIHYGYPAEANSYNDDIPNRSRRSFLFGASVAIGSTIFAQEKKKVDGGLAKIEAKVAPDRSTPVTPPGSLSFQNLAKHCTGCQLCISECPNDVLRPSTGLFTLMQPYSSFEKGYCRPECTRCSEVCPTGAIRKIEKADKAVIQTGHAVWIRWNCIPVRDGVQCGNCARHCPVGAIDMVDGLPVVNETRCIGCGACENLCPSRPLSAIYVEGHEQHSIIL